MSYETMQYIMVVVAWCVLPILTVVLWRVLK